MKKGALAIGIILLFLFTGCIKNLKQVAEEIPKAEEYQKEVPQKIESIPDDTRRASQEHEYINGPDDATIQRICAEEDWPPDCNEIPFPQGVEMCKRCKVISGEAPILESDDKFIVANPLDLSQISRISKFRSCYGHDYSGLNIKREKETLRSMKHYIEPFQNLIKLDTVRVFAPFDGRVAEILVSPPGKQIFISASKFPEWHFIFFHLNLNSDIQEGTIVRAGQLIGYAYMIGTHNFDIALKKFSVTGEYFDSPFMHIQDSILNEYTSYGVTQGNIIVPKEVRDNNPCPVQGTRDGAAAFPGPEKDDFVTLK